MSRFRFRLEPVLHMREQAEERARLALSRAEQQLLDAERRLRDASDALASAYASAEAAEQAGDDVVRLTWHRNWIVVKARDVEAARLDVRERRETRDARLQQTQQAHQQVRVLERFKERARRIFDEEEARRERLALDELAVIQAARRAGDFM